MQTEEPIKEEQTKSNHDKGAAKQAIELIELTVQYVREQAQAIAYDSFFAPMELAKRKLFAGIIGGFAIGISLIFLAIGFVYLLMVFMPAWSAYLLIGALLLAFGVLVNLKGKNGKT